MKISYTALVFLSIVLAALEIAGIISIGIFWILFPALLPIFFGLGVFGIIIVILTISATIGFFAVIISFIIGLIR